MSIRLAPSILAADFSVLGAAISAAERGGADYIHVDVMDGHFVPNLTVGPPVVRSIRKVAKVPLDVHLMIENPDLYIPAFAEAGANMISVHVEAVRHLHRTVAFIKSFGLRAGVVLNPATPVAALEQIAPDADYVLLMTVNPGFGGQTFIPRSTSKIEATRVLLDRCQSAAPIEVDGGIDLRTVGPVVEAGAEILVAGVAVFHAPDPAESARALKAAAEQAALRRAARLGAGTAQ